ncbi:MAG: hypothetical protein K2X93_28480, partial [Candidatus Obscuribacterales bacterium]|nr:hypothetical protein [Candidatus Obscuribacterales bacterium]
MTGTTRGDTVKAIQNSDGSNFSIWPPQLMDAYLKGVGDPAFDRFFYHLVKDFSTADAPPNKDATLKLMALAAVRSTNRYRKKVSTKNWS